MAFSFTQSPSYKFTSDSVTEGHPDKLCDQISDSILDSILADDPTARVACEVSATTGLVVVMGEITTDTYIDIPTTVRNTIKEIGYTDSSYGFELLDQGIYLDTYYFGSCDESNQINCNFIGEGGIVCFQVWYCSCL